MVFGMTKPAWFDNRVGLGNVISWLGIFASAVYTLTVVQSDVKALQAFRDDTKVEIAKFREQRAADREALIEMRGDIRVIRQILEQQNRPVTPR